MRLQPLDSTTRYWANALVAEHFGSTTVVSKGLAHDVSDLPGLVAMHDDRPSGVLHYRIDNGECEVVSLVAATSGQGAGSALVTGIRALAVKSGCARLWVITTNDNVNAQRFYRALGFSQVAVYLGAVTASRALKPEIPLLGQDDVPIEDEIEYELPLRT